VLRFLLYQDSD